MSLAVQLTLEEAEEIIGAPASTWHGRCYEIASRLAPHLGGRAVYGIWLGPIAPDSVFAGRQFTHHGWVRQPDRIVCDPTRFTLEAPHCPAIYYGPEGREYDQGGNRLREAFESSRPGPPSGNVEPVTIDFGRAAPCVAGLLGWDPAQGLSRQQLLWLANRPPHRLHPFAAEVYGVLKDAGWGALIPLDNQREVLG